MFYPDEEKITYSYNLGGQLEKVHGYKSYGYDYVSRIGYDKFEQRTYLKYCNGAETFYTYAPQCRTMNDYVDGEVVQHIEYVPFGEVFVEERNNIWNTPYLFNAKEFYEETGLYYYGARYHDPRVSLWMNVDSTLSKRKNKRNKI